MVLSDEGPINITHPFLNRQYTPTFSYFDLYLNTAYTAHYVYLTIWVHFDLSPLLRCLTSSFVCAYTLEMLDFPFNIGSTTNFDWLTPLFPQGSPSSSNNYCYQLEPCNLTFLYFDFYVITRNSAHSMLCHFGLLYTQVIGGCKLRSGTAAIHYNLKQNSSLAGMLAT